MPCPKFRIEDIWIAHYRRLEPAKQRHTRSLAEHAASPFCPFNPIAKRFPDYIAVRDCRWLQYLPLSIFLLLTPLRSVLVVIAPASSYKYMLPGPALNH